MRLFISWIVILSVLMLIPDNSFSKKNRKRFLSIKEINIEYSKLEDIKRDGKKAIGRFAVLKLKLVAVGQNTVTFTDGNGSYIKATFQSFRRRRVRRIMRDLFYSVIFEIDYVSDSGEIYFDFVNIIK